MPKALSEPASGTGALTANGRHIGSSFALTPTIAVTAAHVIGNVDNAMLRYLPISGEPIAVQKTTVDRQRDVALLHLTAQTSAVPGVAQGKDGMRWSVHSHPRPEDPLLDGTVTCATRDVLAAAGISTTVLQLQVNQHLRNFSGYSGSAVVMSGSGAVIGLLIEQVPERRAIPGEPVAASDVLYAVPIDEVLDLLPSGHSVEHIDAASALSFAVLDEIHRLDHLLDEARATATKRQFWKRQDKRLSAIRECLQSIDDAFVAQGEVRDQYLAAADTAARKILAHNAWGRTAGQSNREWSSIGHVVLCAAATMRNMPEVAQNHMLEAFADNPFTARTKWFPAHYKDTLAVFCSDIYADFAEGVDKIDKAQSLVALRAALNMAGVVVGGAMVVSALSGGRFVNTSGLARELLEVSDEDARRWALKAHWMWFRRRLDARCQEVATELLKGKAHATDHVVAGHRRGPLDHFESLL